MLYLLPECVYQGMPGADGPLYWAVCPCMLVTYISRESRDNVFARVHVVAQPRAARIQ